MIQQYDASARAIVVVYHRRTGKIRQVVHCSRQDAERQHQAWPDHHFLDVTETYPHANPEIHKVDLDIGMVVLI